MLGMRVMEMDGQLDFTVLPNPTEHKLLYILRLPSSTLHQRDYTSIQWLILDHCSTTFNFLLPNFSNPKIWNAHNLPMVSL